MSEIKLDSHFNISIGEKPREIKMSFGLLNELVRTIGDIESVAEIGTDIGLRDAVLIEIFSERDSRGKIKEPASLFNLEVPIDELSDLLDWAGAHVTDFLLLQLTKTKAMLDQRMPKIQALTPTLPGSES